MTVSIQVSNYLRKTGILFERWMTAYGFTITSGNADVVVIDYDTWMAKSKDTFQNTLTVIVSSHQSAFMQVPPDALFLLIPIDYMVIIEYIIHLLKSREK